MRNKAVLLLCLVYGLVPVRAQVLVDNSFGNEAAFPGSNFKNPMELGETVGDNLFHSFSEISLSMGNSETFTGPNSINNILNRVTGDKISEIDGLIKSEITDVNFYLLNPNAWVDVDGGNIEIRTLRLLVLQGADLVANAIQGDGGNIAIAAEGFLPSRDSLIRGLSELGLEGSIEIETPETGVGAESVVLPESLVEQEVNLSDRYALMLSGDVSSVFVNGDGGIPAWSPGDVVPSLHLNFQKGNEKGINGY